jgi:HEAT repeat protein
MRRLSIALALAVLAAASWSEDRAKDTEAKLTAEAKELAGRLASKDPDVVYEAIKEAAQNQHALLTDPLVKLLKSPRPELRGTAIEALGTRFDASARKKAAKALSARLGKLSKKEEDANELMKSITALHDLAQTVSIKPLLSDIDRNTDGRIARARVMAVANIPDAEAIDSLIKFAGKSRRMANRGKVVRDALIYATGERIKGDVDAWRSWWKENKRTFDFQAAQKKREEAKQKSLAAKNKKKNRNKKGGGRKKKKQDNEGDDAS